MYLLISQINRLIELFLPTIVRVGKHDTVLSMFIGLVKSSITIKFANIVPYRVVILNLDLFLGRIV